MKYVTLHGMRFCRDEKFGYYRNGTHHKLAHRHVWECERGPIPDGWHVHHIDRDRGNNEIDNLMCISAEDHMLLHASEPDFELRQRRAIWFASIRPKTKEWHSSPDGLAWHHAHYAEMGHKMHEKAEYACAQCGKVHDSVKRKGNRYCSNKCRSAYRRASGVDDQVRRCAQCGNDFSVNRFKKNQTCSYACANRKRDSIGAMWRGSLH